MRANFPTDFFQPRSDPLPEINAAGFSPLRIRCNVASRSPVLVEIVWCICGKSTSSDKIAAKVYRPAACAAPPARRAHRARLNAEALAVTTIPPFGTRANAASAPSICVLSRTSIGTTSRLNDAAADWIAPNRPIPADMAGSRTIATLATPGAISFSSFPPICHQSCIQAP